MILCFIFNSCKTIVSTCGSSIVLETNSFPSFITSLCPEIFGPNDDKKSLISPIPVCLCSSKLLERLNPSLAVYPFKSVLNSFSLSGYKENETKERSRLAIP